MAGPSARYDRIAAAIHWLTAALVVLIIGLALFGEPVGDWLGFSAIGLHKSLGMTVFALTLARILWRVTHRAPPLPARTPRWQRASAHGVHGFIYALLLGLPVSGYIFGSGGPYPMRWFGIDIPKAPIAKPVADLVHSLHEIGGFAMIGLLVAHVGAACWHQWVQRDGLILRMSLAREDR